MEDLDFEQAHQPQPGQIQMVTSYPFVCKHKFLGNRRWSV